MDCGNSSGADGLGDVSEVSKSRGWSEGGCLKLRLWVGKSAPGNDEFPEMIVGVGAEVRMSKLGG